MATAKLVLGFTVLDVGYDNGEFRFFQETGDAPAAVQAPLDTGLTVINPTDSDPELHSYMGGPGLDQPRCLLCIITTDPVGDKSTCKFFVTSPDTPKDPAVTWTIVAGGTTGIELVDALDTPYPMNPQGVAQVGGFLYIINYDDTSLYRIDIAAFEGTTGDLFTLTDDAIVDLYEWLDPPEPPAPKPTYHGAAIAVLTEPPAPAPDSTRDDPATPSTWLYALYDAVDAEDPNEPGMPTSYVESPLIKMAVDPATGALDYSATVKVGKNARALVPVNGGIDGVTIFVPGVGGVQQGGTTNGADSILYRVPAFANFSSPVAALTGDAAAAVGVDKNFDIRSIAVSDDDLAFLLTVTFGANYTGWWRLYQTTGTYLLGLSNTTIGNATGLNMIACGYGTPGNDWELAYQNAANAANGKLWSVLGTPIRVCEGHDYDNFRLFGIGSLYTGDVEFGANVNSVDLIGEMIYQFGKGNSIDTRLIKGKISRMGTGSMEEEEEDEDEEK
jgi:hypothetical protein